MNEHLPYEEQVKQQLADLPLPEENMAWSDMKRRLEEDDDDGIIPFWLRGCGLWGLLSVVLLGLGWWLLRENKYPDKKEEIQKVQRMAEPENIPGKSKKNVNDNVQEENKDMADKPGEEKTNIDENNTVAVETASNRKLTAKDTGDASGVTIQKNKKEIIVTKKAGSVATNKKTSTKQRKQSSGNDAMNITAEPGSKNKKTGQDSLQAKKETGILITDTSATTVVSTNKTDTAGIVIKDSIKKNGKEQTAKESLPKKDSIKKKPFSFSAGIGLHQLVPIAGQKLTPYNSQGRKGSLADYIPSAYFSMYREGKWFLQSEFRYGAPQSVKETVFQQTIVPDTGANPQYTTTTSSKLKKTFYHQLSFTFNYIVRPNWSLGAGIVWNKFSSAVYEEEIMRRNNFSGQDSIVSKEIKSEHAYFDTTSVFSRNYLQAVIETQYKWKRFSLGARYSFGLQPYIKFSLDGINQQQEKNKSLQLFMRYELWKSKNKKK
ncbi:MAG TPA: hypothetical protein VIZ28_16470 [Chitinophagaceae bacterium]